MGSVNKMSIDLQSQTIDTGTANVHRLAASRQPTWGDALRAYEYQKRNIVDPRLLDGEMFIFVIVDNYKYPCCNPT